MTGDMTEELARMEELLGDVMDRVDGKYYGKYRGFVVDNRDPERRGRLRLQVPSLLGEAVTGWALPCLPFGGLVDQGLFAVPERDAQVWVEFEEGELSHPIWCGVFWQGAVGALAKVDDERRPTTRGLRTPSGHQLAFDDTLGQESIELTHRQGARLAIDPKGTITLASGDGTQVTVDGEAKTITIEDGNRNTLTLSATGTTVKDSHGNTLEMAAAGITVKGQRVVVQGSQVLLGGEVGEPLIKGTSFLALFNAHVHATAMGPSGPPTPPGEPSVLSTQVMSG